jgi:hypothetical protein
MMKHLLVLIVQYLLFIILSCQIIPISSAKNHTHKTSSNFHHHHHHSNQYPSSIKTTKVRKDPHTGKPVERGRLEHLGGISSYTLKEGHNKWTHRNRFSYQQFRRSLQCSPIEPNLDSPNGIMSLMRLLPVSKHMVELACAYAEQSCLDVHERLQLQDCASTAEKLKRNHNQRDTESLRKGPSDFIRLMRVYNSTLYYDWPWKLPDEFRKRIFQPNWLELRLFVGVLELIHDMPDSVFLSIAFDYYFSPPFFPFPVLSHGPSIASSDMPWPWVLVFNDEIIFHQKHVVKSSKPTSDVSDFNPESDKVQAMDDFSPFNNTAWNKRVSKAAFYGALWFSKESVSRQVVLDLSLQYPDYIVANWSKSIGPSDYYHYESSDRDARTGRLSSLVESEMESSKRVPLNIYMSSYKYLPVLAGNSISERLNYFLAHSGAVLLLQETDLQYHFSARLKPWVHYVPLSYTAADIVEKVKWLQEHDDLARQIAKNGWNFGQSYLRLEDYYCYAATALHEISQVETDEAKYPFSQLTPVLTVT